MQRNSNPKATIPNIEMPHIQHLNSESKEYEYENGIRADIKIPMPSLSTAEDTNPFGPQTIENDNSNSTDVL
jgi:hypothetical protein